ncbi:trypco2 family protein [Streptomyces araujoniae]|uniref:trypco2 family protein n=1 Tax=Streptomyces sp. ZEA17I TaxID=2202516 RepID=UPI000D6ED3CB|nr:trypco2 family protein [Streptomyces sp. ZEA17I]
MTLEAAIAGVRQALGKAREDATGERFRFGLSSVDLDFHIEFSAGASTDGPAELRVVQLTEDSAAGHRIKLSLRPLDLSNGTQDDVFIEEITRDLS